MWSSRFSIKNIRAATNVPSRATQSQCERSMVSCDERTNQGIDFVYTALIGARQKSAMIALKLGLMPLKS